MNKKIAFFFIAIVLLGLFTGFSKFVKREGMKQIDFDVTVRVQDKISSSAGGRIDELMDDGAILADGIVSSGITLAITAWLLVDRKKKKIRWTALVIPVMFALFIGIEIYGKNVLPHSGPPFFMIKKPTTIFPKFHVIQPYSYPSGHAGRVTFLAIITGWVVVEHFAKKKEKKMIMLAAIAGYVLFVWVSRIYLGHHWLSDIVGGILVGAASSLAAVGFL